METNYNMVLNPGVVLVDVLESKQVSLLINDTV